MGLESILAGIGGGLISGVGSVYNNERNIDFQRETNAANAALTRESWSRDDNAIQRRVSDLRAAGLSPVLAAGVGASNSAPIQVRSPEAGDNVANSALQGAMTSASIAATHAAADASKQQADATRLGVETAKATQAANIAAALSQAQRAQSDAVAASAAAGIAAKDWKVYEKTGVNPARSGGTLGLIGNALSAVDSGKYRKQLDEILDNASKANRKSVEDSGLNKWPWE